MTAETTRTVRAAANDPKAGMTLDELDTFVKAAREAEIPGNAIVKATATWRSSIKRVEAQG